MPRAQICHIVEIKWFLSGVGVASHF
jgi:hypothetical protein